ncbi:MAG: hypothetical protein ACYCO9_16870 [Streptosporangiaceae bacterium]
MTRPLMTASQNQERADANGTMWRLRSLTAMGHDTTRIARALGTHPVYVHRVIHGRTGTITPVFRDDVIALWDAWWDKTPPQTTAARRRAAARARHLAEANGWPAAAGLDEDQLDQPGYRPWCRYRPATGTGTAPDITPATLRTTRPAARDIA